MKRLLIPSLIVACLGSLVVACFGPALFKGEQFAYRDSAHFYYPLYERVQREWQAGRWPLWEPEENSGMPLMGNPTAAVLYPGKVIYALFPYPLAARLYIVGHTLLAFGTMFLLLRHWGTSRAGSALGAMSYAFGGPILFQYCNIIYLVGAAWLPLGFLAADAWVRQGRRWSLAVLAVALAMENLGGDPESAYLTGVCAAGYAGALAWGGRGRDGKVPGPGGNDRTSTVLAGLVVVAVALVWVNATIAIAQAVPGLRPVAPPKQPQRALPWMPWVGPAVALAWGGLGVALLARSRRRTKGGGRPVLLPMMAGLVVAAAVAVAGSAAQLFPVLEFTGQTIRAAGDGPHDIYPFSLHPGRVVEFLWPNPFGTPYHGNRLWLNALPPKDANPKVWIPTLYVGGLTLVLVLGTLGVRGPGGRAPWRGWMTAIAVVSLLGSFGEFGSPLWFARMAPKFAGTLGPHDTLKVSTIRDDGQLRDGDGGIYWVLATALPGFRQFRFPSKLLTFTVLALAVLAGQGWDTLASGDPRARRRTAAWAGSLMAVSLAALILLLSRRAEFIAWLGAQELDSGFGPVDVAGAFAETRASLVQATAVLGGALALTWGVAGRYPVLGSVLALGLTTADLAAANSKFVATAPQNLLETKPDVVTVIERAEKERPTPGPYRVHRMPVWNPPAWGEDGSDDRVRDFLVWERETIQPKYGINLGVEYTNTLGVAELYDYEWFFGGFYYTARRDASAVLGTKPGATIVAYARRAFDMWNTRYFVLPYYPKWDDEHRGIASFIDRTERVYPPTGAFRGPGGKEKERDWIRNHDYQVRRNLDEYPRAWAVHDARSMPTFRGLNRASREMPMQEILFSNDMTWPDPTRNVYDPRRYVWVEESERPALAPFLPGGYPDPTEDVRVVRHDPDRVEIRATLNRPGVVVLADVYYPGWTLTVDGKPSGVFRANRVMRGAAVPSGQHTLIYTFRPASFRVGLIVSGFGLAGLGGLVLWPAFSKGPARFAHPEFAENTP